MSAVLKQLDPTSLTDSPSASLNQRLADLHAERVATWEPAALQVNIDQRARIEAEFDRKRAVSPGDTIAPFSVPDVDGRTVTLDQLLEKGPLVLVFFRFAGCPACNIALPYYAEALYPGLIERGATLAAISPQPPHLLVEIRNRHHLPFAVLSDTGNAIARELGVLYSFDEPSRAAAESKGAKSRDLNGTDAWELPLPTVLVIDRDRVVRYAESSPDWLVRTEAAPILRAVEALAVPQRR